MSERHGRTRDATAQGPRSNYQRALDFHLRIGDDPPDGPTRPDDATLALRMRLLREEASEALDALATLAASSPARDAGPAAGSAGAAAGLGARTASAANPPDATVDAALAAAAHELADLVYVAYGTFVALGIDADAAFAEVHDANLRKAGAPRRADGKQLRPPGWHPADLTRSLAEQRQAARQGHLIELLRSERPERD